MFTNKCSILLITRRVHHNNGTLNCGFVSRNVSTKTPAKQTQNILSSKTVPPLNTISTLSTQSPDTTEPATKKKSTRSQKQQIVTLPPNDVPSQKQQIVTLPLNDVPTETQHDISQQQQQYVPQPQIETVMNDNDDYWNMTNKIPSQSTNTNNNSKYGNQAQTSVPQAQTKQVPMGGGQTPERVTDDQQMETKSARQQNPVYSLYRASAQVESGAVFQFHYDEENGSVFIHAARQKIPKHTTLTPKGLYDWEKKILFKLSVNEMGKILAFLSTPPPPGTNAKVSFIHVMENATQGRRQSTLTLEPGKNVGSLRLLVSRYRKDNDTYSVGIYFDMSEACVLREFLRESIRRGCGFK